ncbi:MAG: Crp/Fnr family transcriptional regulator [Fimbriimonadaceae bacterium]
MTVVEAISKSYLATGLNPAQVEEIARISYLQTYQMHDKVLSATDDSGDLKILASGRVSITTPAGDVLATLDSGAVFGEISLLDEGPRSANINALETCEVVTIPSDKLQHLMRQDTHMAANLLLNVARVLAHRLRSTSAHLGEILAPRDHGGGSADMWSF